MKKKLTIKDFPIKEYVEWEQLARVFGKREHKKFMSWLAGQTCYKEGVFVYDLKRYLEGDNSFD